MIMRINNGTATYGLGKAHTTCGSEKYNPQNREKRNHGRGRAEKAAL